MEERLKGRIGNSRFNKSMVSNLYCELNWCSFRDSGAFKE